MKRAAEEAARAAAAQETGAETIDVQDASKAPEESLQEEPESSEQDSDEQN